MVPASWHGANGDHELLAIIGMACRLPGGISTPSELWDMLVEGRSGRRGIPISRFNKEAFYHPDPQHPASINAPAGYFIDGDIRDFDNEFFGINNLEAQYMDPQQRQLLEVAFECLESAGISLRDISNTDVGCYVANFTTDYTVMQSKDPELYHRYSGTGMGTAILANRISHAFNLKGPSVTIDTACSSSVYALHLACTALQNRECDGAIIGGANIIQSPELYMGAVKAGMTSGTSTCHTFDIAADGYARAEGVGVLYVKRLGDAIRDGDPIRSVIRGTAINSNGKTSGISLPSAPGQEAVIRKAYTNANISPDSTDYIEAHGTGTEVGDGIEVAAFSRVLRHHSGRPMLIGSVKTNLGHAEAVSGITSMIKVTLALEHGLIPKTIGVETINPKLQLNERNARIATTNTPWPDSSLRRASVNSFGYGGSNGHVILEAAMDHVAPRLNRYSAARYFVLPLSASSTESLDARRVELAQVKISEESMEDLAFTLSCRRSHLPYRGFLVSPGRELEADHYTEKMETALQARRHTIPSYLFVFTGQGCQWPGMGRTLMNEFPVFSNTVEKLCQHLSTLSNPPTWNLRDILEQSEHQDIIDCALVSQTACTAIQIALVELLRHLGVTSATVVGHSSGEIAAAYAAGYLTAKQAISIAYYRGLIVSTQAPKGAMAAVGVDTQNALDLVTKSGHEGKIEVACINSSNSVTVSGEATAVDDFVAQLESQGVFVRKLKTDNKAYHSRHMKLIGQSYASMLSGIFDAEGTSSATASIKMISSVTASEVAKADVSSPEYWRNNLESQVRFSDALKAALSAEDCHIIEIGAHNALKAPSRDMCKLIGREDCPYIPTMIRGKDSTITILQMVGRLFLHGCETPIEVLNGRIPQDGLNPHAKQKQAQVLTDLPAYKWHRHQQPLWSEGRLSYEYRTRKYPRHDLLGCIIPGGSGQVFTWRNVLRVDDVPWLGDHKLGDTIVFPAAGYLAMAVEAFCQARTDLVYGSRSLAIRNVKFLNFLTFHDRRFAAEIFTELVPVQNSMVSASKTVLRFTISTFEAGASTVHARGLITTASTHMRPRRRHQGPRKEGMERQAIRTWYRKMQAEGLNFGETFQRLTEVYNNRLSRTRRTVADIGILENRGLKPESAYLLHPAYIDALLQTSIISTAAGAAEQLRGKVPVSIDSAVFHFDSGLVVSSPRTIRASSEFEGMYTAIAHSELSAINGDLLLEISGLQIVPWRRYSVEHESSQFRQPMMQIKWKPDISAINSGNTAWLDRYIAEFAAFHGMNYTKTDQAQTAALVDLCCHKAPGALRILHLTEHKHAAVESFTDLLDTVKPLKRAKSYHLAHLTADGELEYSLLRDSRTENVGPDECINSIDRRGSEVSFDLIIAPFASVRAIDVLSRHLRPQGRLILSCQEREHPLPLVEHELVLKYEFSQSATTSLALFGKQDCRTANGISSPPPVVVVCRTVHHPFQEYLNEHLSQFMIPTANVVLLQDVSKENIPTHCVVICALELEKCILSTIGNVELGALQIISEKASAIVWLQSADLFSASNPDMALVRGLSRTLVMEHPALRFFVFDIGVIQSEGEMELTLSHLKFILDEAAHNSQADLEYVQLNGALYVSRFGPADSLNERFHAHSNNTPVSQTLAGIGRSRLFLKDAGRFESLCFTPASDEGADLGPTSVEVQTKAVSMNAKDYYALKGLVNTKDATCSLDFSGVVTRVGPEVSELRPGDRVVAMAPNRFETHMRVPEWACCKLAESEDYVVMSTVPIVFATALYALHHRAQIRSGESILIHSAAGGAGIAAIQIAQLAGANIFATVGTEAKKDFLVDQFGLRREWIFSSRDSSFLSSILEITGGSGVDIVLNSLTGDLLQASWEACSDFGRFIDISKRDSVDGGRLDMNPFVRNTSYHAFDLSGLYYSRNTSTRDIWRALLQQSVDMTRSGIIKPIEPLTVFDVSEIGRAFQHFGSSSRIGKIAISLEDVSSKVQFLPDRYSTIFSPEKSYILVGCLGGLGSTLSKWMVERGARHLVFLGRSGAARPAAQKQIEILQQAGAIIRVVQGDVASLSDVQRAVSQNRHPVGGIVHAAMDLEEALFTQMTAEKWHSCLNPKVQGAWNLHQALIGQDSALDFFLMMSSVTGSVGLVTESNYCAANSFLDHFARYRRSLGLPAISVGLGVISDAGYLHEHPEIETTLLRKGMHPYTEEELLQVVDTALSGLMDDQTPAGTLTGGDRMVDAHILTGLELQGLQRILQKGFDAQNSILNDPRAALLARALEASEEAQAVQNKKEKQGTGQRPQELADALAAVSSSAAPDAGARLAGLVESMVAETFANLLLLPVEKLMHTSRLAEFGMDSMLAAEFRASVFKVFGVDVSFTTLLEERTIFADLVKIVVEELLRTRNGGL